jgi:hypothetical protein
VTGNRRPWQNEFHSCIRCAGSQGASNQETEYLKALEGAQRFEVRGGRLYLFVNGTEKPLVFHRAS